MAEENVTMKDMEQELNESYKQLDERNQMLENVDDEKAAAWENLIQLKEDNTIFDVTVSGVVKGGVVALVDEIRGFIPASKLALGFVENLEDYLKKDLKVQIIDIVPEENRLILSAKEPLLAAAREARKQKMEAIQVGAVMEGTVETIKDYGAFIDLGDGISGLLHVSQISEKRIKTPAAVLNVGDPVKVKVTAIKDGKLSLSMKALNAPVEEKEEKIDYKLPKSEEIGTSLGSLFKNIKL